MTLGNPSGFHPRAIARLMALARGYDATVELSAGGQTSGTGSLIGLMKLGAGPGTATTVRAAGPQAAEAVAAVARFLEEDRT